MDTHKWAWLSDKTYKSLLLDYNNDIENEKIR